MKRLTFFLIVVLSLSFGSVFAAEKGMTPLSEEFVKLFKANDLDGVVALYARDAVFYPPDTKVSVGTEAIRASWGGLLNAFTVQDIVITNAFHEIVGDTAVGWGNFSMKLTPKDGGDPVTMEGRFTDVSKKMDGKWLYVHDHASFTPQPPESK